MKIADLLTIYSSDTLWEWNDCGAWCPCCGAHLVTISDMKDENFYGPDYCPNCGHDEDKEETT